MSDKLGHYLSIWQLTEPHLIARTPTSHVYAVNQAGVTVVLKVLTPIGIADEGGGAAALVHFGGRGAVRLLRHDAGAHLLEYAPGNDLVAMVAAGDDDQATRTLAQVLNALHQPDSPPPPGLTSLRRRFASLFKRATLDEQAGQDSLMVRAAAVAQRLLAQPREVCVLHGDMHHANVRHKPGRGWLAIDPKGLVGERIFDAANILCNPDMPDFILNEARLLRRVAILSAELGIEAERLLAYTYAYAALSACWSFEDGDDPAIALGIARLIEPHIMR